MNGNANKHGIFVISSERSKQEKNGRFEPVSGQFDPELSVKQILRPLPQCIR